MAPNASTFFNFNTNNHAVSIRQNICHKFNYNNNASTLLLKNRLKSIRENFTAVNSYYLKENYIESVNNFSSVVSQEKNESTWLDVASMRLELIRKVIVKQNVQEKMEEWQKKKHEMLQNRKFDNSLEPTFNCKDIILEKENYKLILDQIQKRTSTKQVISNYQQRSREICFKGALAKAVLTVDVINNYFIDLKLVSNIGKQIDVYNLMKTKLDILKNVKVVEEDSLIAIQNVLKDLMLFKNNVVIPIQTKLAEITTKTDDKKNILKYFSVNMPDKKIIKRVRRQYISLVKNNKKLINNLNLIEKLTFTNDPIKKIFRQNVIKVINTLINTISSTNAAHLTEKYNKLNALLSGKLVSVANIQVKINNKDALAFCMETLATKIINYAEEVICVKTESAYEIATIVVKLWGVHPQFGEILFAKIKQKCPLLVPFSCPIAKYLTSEQKLDHKSFGYKFDSSGNIESHSKYLKRMIGIVRLYAAIIVISSKYKEPVIGISQAWIFIAGTLNQCPVADITATILVEFLNIVGFTMNQLYGIQFIKLLKYINIYYMKKIILVTPMGYGGPITRLNNYISKSLFNGLIEEPKGMLSSDYL